MKVDKKCKKCGIDLIQVHQATKFCDDCRQEIYREAKKISQQKRRNIKKENRKIGNCIVCGNPLTNVRYGAIVCENLECKKERLRRNSKIYDAKKLKPYPHWVCNECGLKASKGRQYKVSTWHIGKCEVCGEEKEVTESRDFFYPKFKGHQYKLQTKLQQIL